MKRQDHGPAKTLTREKKETNQMFKIILVKKKFQLKPNLNQRN